VKTQHDVMFAVGIGLGAAAGFVLGSFVAFKVGEGGVDAARRFVERLLGKNGGPKFEYLLQ
jgi:hypothetical protein